jgi:hypothetical protein
VTFGSFNLFAVTPHVIETWLAFSAGAGVATGVLANRVAMPSGIARGCKPVALTRRVEVFRAGAASITRG